MPSFIFKTAAVMAAGLLLTACAGNGTRPDSAAGAMNNNDYYEAYHEGRVYVFDDADTFREFLAVGETAFRKARIGAGPNGETVIFGLSDADKKKQEGIASVDMYDGKLAGGEDFYGEIHKDGRIFVCDRWEDLQHVKRVGAAALMYTQIGAGPRGETVIFVLNEDNKKEKPTDLMARFRQFHG